MKRAPGSQRWSWLPSCRWRRDYTVLLTLFAFAMFFSLRVSQLRQSSRDASTIRTVLTTTQVLHGGRAGEDDEPTSVVTELVIDSSGGRRRVEAQKGGDFGVGGGSSGAGVARDTAADRLQYRGGVGAGLQRDSRAGAGQRGGGGGSGSGGDGVIVRKTTAQLYAEKQAAALARALPRDFDWQTYLLYHPDLRASGINEEQKAKDHYVKQGRAEGRIYKRLRVLLRYTACTGLINQQYSHIAAFSLAAVLGAEIVLPPAAKRDSFAHYFSVFKEHNEVSWTSAPLESLLNVDRLIDVWRGKGLTVHRTPALTPFPDLTAPEVAYPLFTQPDIDPRMVTRISGVYLKNLDMPELIEKARSAVIDHTAKLLRADNTLDLTYVVLDLPCTFFMLRSLSNLRVVTEVARSLEFAPAIVELADRVVASIAAAATSFNAVHLRIEKDARDWSQIMGGPEAVWNAYVVSMRQAGFTPDVPMYVASGLLTYGASDDMNRIIGMLKAAGLCSEVLYKELYISQKEIDGLNSEQKALLDFLVLAKGKFFVGFGSSTFSFYLREHRVLQGMQRSSSVLVDASVIGTDPLFNSAGTVS